MIHELEKIDILSPKSWTRPDLEDIQRSPTGEGPIQNLTRAVGGAYPTFFSSLVRYGRPSFHLLLLCLREIKDSNRALLPLRLVL